MPDHATKFNQGGRPSNERDGACVCDYNPSTTDGPQEDCPFHGRPYAYWIERGDALAERLTAVAALADEWERTADECERLSHVRAGLSDERDLVTAGMINRKRAENLRAALSPPATPSASTAEEA